MIFQSGRLRNRSKRPKTGALDCPESAFCHPGKGRTAEVSQVFERLASVRGTLTTGDYSVAALEDLFSIERNTVSDLVGCCMGENRERFERELHRLRGYRFKRLLVVGSEAEILAGQYHSNIKPKAVLATVCAFEVRYDLPVVYVPSAQTGARLVERWSFYFARQAVETVNNKKGSRYVSLGFFIRE